MKQLEGEIERLFESTSNIDPAIARWIIQRPRLSDTLFSEGEQGVSEPGHRYIEQRN